jgi:hypothetical protein
MLGFGRKKNLPNPATNTTPSTTQDYLAQAMGAPSVQIAPKKKRVKLDSGGQPFRGQERLA